MRILVFLAAAVLVSSGVAGCGRSPVDIPDNGSAAAPAAPPPFAAHALRAGGIITSADAAGRPAFHPRRDRSGRRGGRAGRARQLARGGSPRALRSFRRRLRPAGRRRRLGRARAHRPQPRRRLPGAHAPAGRRHRGLPGRAQGGHAPRPHPDGPFGHPLRPGRRQARRPSFSAQPRPGSAKGAGAPVRRPRPRGRARRGPPGPGAGPALGLAGRAHRRGHHPVRTGAGQDHLLPRRRPPGWSRLLPRVLLQRLAARDHLGRLPLPDRRRRRPRARAAQPDRRRRLQLPGLRRRHRRPPARSTAPSPTSPPIPPACPTAATRPSSPPDLVSMESFKTRPPGFVDPWLPATAVQTLGNNVDAYADLFAPDGFSNGDLRATTTAPGTFDRVYDTAAEPGASTSQTMAATTNLFYLINWLHDYWYDSGFDEAAGNAQAYNFGRGGSQCRRHPRRGPGLGRAQQRQHVHPVGRLRPAHADVPLERARTEQTLTQLEPAAARDPARHGRLRAAELRRHRAAGPGRRRHRRRQATPASRSPTTWPARSRSSIGASVLSPPRPRPPRPRAPSASSSPTTSPARPSGWATPTRRWW